MLLTSLLTLAMVPVSLADEGGGDPCVVDRSSVRFTARVAVVPEVSRSRSAVVVCDQRTGRERRSRTVRLSNARGGRAFLAAAASDTQIAWIEATYSRANARVVLMQASRGSFASKQRRVLYEGRIELRSHFGVVFTRGGRLVVSSPEGVRVGDRRVVAGPVSNLGIEDGATLRFTRQATGRTYLELSPVRRDRAGCPVRERFRRTYASKDVVLTVASYGDLYNRTDVWRACLTRSDRDPVVAVTEAAPSSPTGPLLGLDPPWVITGGTSNDKYHNCSTTLRAVNTQTGALGPSSDAGTCDPLLAPDFGDAVAVTDRGRIAWLERSSDVWRLQLADGPAGPTTLQAAAPGAIGAPSASGSTITWSSTVAPQARSVTPE